MMSFFKAALKNAGQHAKLIAPIKLCHHDGYFFMVAFKNEGD